MIEPRCRCPQSTASERNDPQRHALVRWFGGFAFGERRAGPSGAADALSSLHRPRFCAPLPAGRFISCRACVSFHFAPRLPAGKAARAIHARAWRAGASLRPPRPCRRGPSRAGCGPFAARGGGRVGWLRRGWFVGVCCGSCACGGASGAVRGAAVAVARAGVVAGWLGVGLGSGWGRAGFCGSGRAWLAAAGAAGSGLSGEWSGGPSGPSGFLGDAHWRPSGCHP